MRPSPTLLYLCMLQYGGAPYRTQPIRQPGRQRARWAAAGGQPGGGEWETSGFQTKQNPRFQSLDHARDWLHNTESIMVKDAAIIITCVLMLSHWAVDWEAYGWGYVITNRPPILLIIYNKNNIHSNQVSRSRWMPSFIHSSIIINGEHMCDHYCTAIYQRPSNTNNNNNKRPLTPKSMPPAGDEHAKLKT